MPPTSYEAKYIMYKQKYIALKVLSESGSDNTYGLVGDKDNIIQCQGNKEQN